MEILALILARGGSQRIPNKNIADLNGQPLISYTINQAKQSKYINRIIVSTNDKQIEDISKEYGAEVIQRPDDISGAESNEIDAFKYTLTYLFKHDKYIPDIIVKLFPTSPFRKVLSIDICIDMMINDIHNSRKYDSIRSIRKCKEHPYKMWIINNNKLTHMIPIGIKPKESHTFSYQKLPEIYINNASIDITTSQTVFDKNSITGDDIGVYEMDELESFDINTPLDLEIANYLLRSGKVKI